MIKLQRWHPTTCDCVIDQEVEYDDVTNEVLKAPSFHLMNEVCDKHAHLKSTEHKFNHHIFAARTMDIIEQAKARNLKQVDDQLANPNLKRKTRKELERCRQQVLQHNQEITEEWQELTEPPHAFDSHIHEAILTEQ